MLTVGDQFPTYELTSCVSLETGKEFEVINHKSYEGKWKVVFAWPKDFTFVCPTEIAAFGKLNDEFADRDAQILGFSGDSEFVHHAWRKDHADLRDLPFPMMADSKHELMRDLGIEGEDGFAQRAVFIVDPNNEIQFTMVTAGSVGRNPKEVLRVLDALQTDELCPCNWKSGDETLDPVKLLAGE
ncbi:MULTISPECIES: peroxiredoxin [Streptomyces]|uniref:Peroxiredoxin n=1 Tax=Streptomyces achmelvichensis TaxID=3134111 RepID=A0ACC6Q0I8_9ACTN|nr:MULTISPECIES: peroxiredoxin [unclassified Streptomyces]WST39908.1 peroxiredoxin [Streptomyces sp. NBC_01167]